MNLIKHPPEVKMRIAGIRRTMLGFTFCCALAVALPGCGKAPQDRQSRVPTPAVSDPAHRLTVAVVPKGTIHEYWKAVNSGAQKAGRELGVEVLWKGPLKEDDREAQVAVVEDLVSRGVAGIVLAPLDATALRGPVASAMRTNIPVVIFDSGLSGEAGKDFVSYVATDNFKGGQLAGEAMAKLLGDKGNVIVLRYAEGSDSTLQRENGFLDAIKKHPGIKVVSENQYAGVTTESAQKAGENLLARFKQSDGTPGFDGIFCATEPTTFGMLRSLQDAGLAGKVHFIGFDSSPKMIQALQNSQLAGFIVQNPRQIGYLGVKTLVTHLRGEKVSPRLDTGATLVTADNLQTTAVATLLHPEQAQ